MKKILVRENAETAQMNISYLETLKQRIESDVITNFLAFNAGNFNNDLLNDCLLGEGQKVRNLVLKQAEADLISMKTPSIRKMILEGVEKSINDFQTICERVKNLTEIKMLPYILIAGNKAKSKPDAEKEIIEGCKTYITTSDEEAIYNALQTVISGCDSLMKAMGKDTKKRIFPYLNIYQYIAHKESGRTVLRDDIDISYLAK